MEMSPTTENDGLVQVVIHTVGTLHADALDLIAAHDGLVFNVGDHRFRTRTSTRRCGS